MTARTSAQALADVASALVADHEITGLLARLVQDCAELLPADAAAILVRTADGEFELLSATSHRAAELELYQAQHAAGPCVDTVRTGARCTPSADADRRAVGRGRSPDRRRRLPGGARLPDALARPRDRRPERLRRRTEQDARRVARSSWRRASPTSRPSPSSNRSGSTDDALAQRVTAALEERVVVEQAKGVLAFQLSLDMADAYDELLKRAAANGSRLRQTALDVPRGAAALSLAATGGERLER